MAFASQSPSRKRVERDIERGRERPSKRGGITPTPMASPVPSSSTTSSTPTSCDMISMIHVKARWLSRMLAWVRATLDDAEDMNTMDASILDWLRQLQEVADAAEDLLDEFPPEALHLGFVGDGGGWSTAGRITELHDQRMEDIVSRFMKIRKPKQALKLDFPEEQMDDERIYARRATSPVMEEPYIVGRIEELDKMKQFLLSSDAEESGGSDGMDDHVSVMAIVGMGGLGKTTLAQLAYNDAQVNQHFQLKSWVCVSEDFDVVRLTKAMLQSLNVEDSGLSEMDPLHQKLVQKLDGKERYLLVLDDVWEAENLNIHSWNTLIAPLRNIFTKIIMTTRSRKVSEMAPRTSTYDLGFLSDEDTLQLFMWHAFEGRDPNLYKNIVAVGKETARKCRGVPLAAKTVGGILHNKDDEEWYKILESEVWNATINQEDSIIPILKLSYQHLTAPLKRCFKYCSMFPKDYVFDRNQIIRMWMAQGYIKANRRELMEDIGQRYIDNLLSRSFFQNCTLNTEGLQMHDLMHDLARCVSAGECYSMEGGKSCLFPSNVRHLSIFGDRRGTIISSRKDKSEPKSFRSFLLPDERYLISHGKLLSDLYTSMEHLRVLDLGGVRLHGLPESISRLKHLRYLRISGFFMELPEFVGSMYHLQTLDLGRVSVLPNSMSNLLNLRHLSGIYFMVYPVGIGKLTNLQTMPGFFVSPQHNHAKLGELKDMNNICGVFAILGLENLADVNEATKACLGNKRNISSLHLEWHPRAASSSIDEEMLESLKPSIKLASLRISGFKGLSYPSWLGDRSFSRLGTIELELCEKWISLPSLGQLPSLKSLSVTKGRAVEYIGGGFFSGGFPQLEELTLREMDNWKSWCGAQEGECSKLKKLSIDRCPNLESLSLSNLGAVVDIYVSIFLGPLELSSYLQRAKRIKIKKTISHGLSIKSHISPAALSEDEPHLQLQYVDQREVEYIFAICSPICRLTVKKCPNLTCLPLGNQNGLKDVEIRDCPDLLITSISPQLWQLPYLRRINVNGIHGAVSITIVRESYVELTNVDQLVASALLKEFSHVIHRLVITRCVNLTSLPWTDLTTLKYLRISECPLFQLLDAEQLPSTLQVLCIFGNPYETEQCSRHQHFQRLKQVQQCSNKKGGERNLYLVFRNVRDASAALEFCSTAFIEIHTLDIEWDCCTNDGYINVTDAITQEVLFNLYSLCISSKKLVIRRYTGSVFAGCYADFSSKTLRIDGFRSRLTHVSLLQCSKIDLAPQSRLHFSRETSDLSIVPFNLYSVCISVEKLVIRGYTGSHLVAPRRLDQVQELYAEGASNLETVDDFQFLWKLVFKHCPKLRALPPLPPRLKELILEGCEELQSLSSSSQGLNFTATKGPPPGPPRLELMSVCLGTKEGDFPFLRKLVLKHCPKVRALPPLPPRLKELILEGCEELHSLSSSSQGLKSVKSLQKLSVRNCPNLDFTATEVPPPRLELMSLSGCPLLLAWCQRHPRMLASLDYFEVDGVPVSIEEFTSYSKRLKLASEH